MIFFNFRKFKLDFIIIGAQKAGTSALDQYLRQHPKIEMAARKELHFFDNDTLFRKDKMDYSIIGNAFPKFKKKKYIYGESTPSYIYWNFAIQRIKNYNPKIKLIAVLRNPTERAFSHWNMEASRNLENRSFKECIDEEIRLIKRGEKEQHKVKSYVERGLYSNQIEEIYSHFSRNQIFFVKYENFLENQKSVIQEVFTFLDLNSNIEEFNPVVSNKIPYSRIMEEEEKNILLSFFRNEIIEVEKLLNWNCNDWKN